MMKNLMREYVENITYLFKNNKVLIIGLAIVCVLSYGFTITHHSIGIDNTAYYYYYASHGRVQQGRLTPYILDFLIKTGRYDAFWTNALSTFIYYFAVLSWCVLFKYVSKDKISQWQLFIFASVFVSFPIINEQFIYSPEVHPIQYLFCSLSLLLFYYINNNNLRKVSLYVALFTCIVIGLSASETFASVFLCGAAFLIIIQYVFNNEDVDVKTSIKYFLKVVAILAAGILIELIINKIVRLIIQPEDVVSAANSIFWLNYPFIYNLKTFIVGIIYRFFLASLFYFPITVLIKSV
jgi:hypothetical protein